MYADISLDYLHECNQCSANNFKRYREIEEVDYLFVGEYRIETDTSDLNVIGDWIFECINCGNHGPDIESLLKDSEDEVDD